MDTWNQKRILLYRRWPWHVLFWTGYILFRLWPYYLTVNFYKPVFLEYMLLSEIIFVAIVYFTLWLYRVFFATKRFLLYFFTGAVCWTIYLYSKTIFQEYYLRNVPGFRSTPFTDVLFSSLPIMFVYFLFITSCKYFKDGYIAQQFEAEKKQQQLVAEINNLKSQIAPHFLFNTLNNLYGLAVDKSDKLPGLMLRLSDLLRHSLYETEKPLVSIADEINVLKSYVELERVRLENDLELDFKNNIPVDSPYQVAPLILIVFMENAFKHSRLVQSGPVRIYINTSLENGWFSLLIMNNYNAGKNDSSPGIGLANVKRRLEVLYPDRKHRLEIKKDEQFFTVALELQLTKA